MTNACLFVENYNYTFVLLLGAHTVTIIQKLKMSHDEKDILTAERRVNNFPSFTS